MCNIAFSFQSLMHPVGKYEEEISSQTADVKLSDFMFGPLIAKGCNSAVYSARLQTG